MKLAEALSLRAQLSIRASQLRNRLKSCVRIQEGDEPAESADEVIAELDKTLAELRRLIYAINMTNIVTIAEDGRNLTSLLAEREALSQKVRSLGEAFDIISSHDYRYGHNELRQIRMVDLADFGRQYNEQASQLRKLDLHIQALGFTADLVEE